MPDKIGDYEIRVGNAAVNFWPLPPGTTVAAATPPAQAVPVAPGQPNAVAVPPAFGIFDIVIATTQDPHVTTAVPAPVIPATITAVPAIHSMPLIPDDAGLINISFAVPIPAADANFSGTLRLIARLGAAAPGTARTLDIPLQITPRSRADELFIFFVLHDHPPTNYAWVKLKAVEQANPATAVAGASGTCKLLRDNLEHGFRTLNRSFAVETGADGFLRQPGSTRNVLGLPLDWPLIVNLSMADFIPRGHLLRLAQANVSHNLAPFVSAPEIRMMREANASLADKRIMLDAGHGVVYDYEPARRAQEWYVAHKICDRIIAILTAAPFNVPAANIFRTRTAGFGLIQPTQVTAGNAPEAGDHLFEFDLPHKRVRARTNAVNLKTISDLLLVRHDATTHAAQPVADADRASIIAASPATFTAIETRLNHSLAPKKRVRPGSMRWDAASADYVYTEEPNPPPNPPPAGTTRHLPIGTSDWFSLSDVHMDVLAERSAHWSLAAELEGGPAADAATGRPEYRTAVRGTMVTDGALDYMKNAILAYVDVAAPHEWLNHGVKGWGPTVRDTYFNTTACDFYISLHENDGRGVGGMALVSRRIGADAPPPDQIRIGKLFLKHIDGFDQGTRQGGLAREEEDNPAAMLHGGNHIRDKYYYGETEFMDRTSATAANRYQMQDMIDGGYIERVAQQIVRSLVEYFLDRQANMDDIRLHNTFDLW